MSTTFWAIDTLAVVMTTDEALELACSWCAQFLPDDDDVLDKNNPQWRDYWMDFLGCSDIVRELYDGNCCGFETVSVPGLEGCGSKSAGLDPMDDTIWYIPCKQAENPFRAAYGSVDDVLDEYQNDEAYITCNQSKQWLRDHLVYITCVRFF